MKRLPTADVGWSRTVHRVAALCSSLVVGVAFWVGIVAPIAYLAVLAPGVHVPGRVSLFLTLVAIHYLALVLGHSHRASEP